MTKEEIEYHKFPIMEDWTREDQDNYERSSRRWNAICDAHENGTISEILEDIRAYQEGLHDVPGVSRYVGLRGLRIVIEICRACNRIAIAQQSEGQCPDCGDDPCSCFYGYGPVTRWDRFTDAIYRSTIPWIRRIKRRIGWRIG
jgi:hypothetical protein